MTTIPRAEQNVLDFLTKLRANWGKRFEDENSEKMWLDQMIDELKGFDEDVLKDAARNLLRKKFQGFPRLAECLDACVDAKKWIDGKKPRLAIEANSGPRAGFSFGRYETLADTLIAGPDGREAARNGYVSSLWDFIAKQGRLPNQYEKADVVRGAAETDAMYADMVRGALSSGDRALDRVLMRSVELMLGRREEMRNRVLGETP